MKRSYAFYVAAGNMVSIFFFFCLPRKGLATCSLGISHWEPVERPYISRQASEKDGTNLAHFSIKPANSSYLNGSFQRVANNKGIFFFVFRVKSFIDLQTFCFSIGRLLIPQSHLFVFYLRSVTI